MNVFRLRSPVRARFMHASFAHDGRAHDEVPRCIRSKETAESVQRRRLERDLDEGSSARFDDSTSKPTSNCNF
jgi:hypothetical protein